MFYKKRSSHQRCSIKKGILKFFLQNSQENTCARVSFLIKLFSCEFCEIFKNIFLTEHLRVTFFAELQETGSIRQTSLTIIDLRQTILLEFEELVRTNLLELLLEKWKNFFICILKTMEHMLS